MAIFEKSGQTKAIIDDTEKLICTLENAQNINKHTEYILRVQRGPNKENKWCVSRRYRDFAGLHGTLQQANIELPLPPKKLIGNMQPSFIAERQIALQNYINEVLKHQILALTLETKIFLDPSNYSQAIAEQAVQTVSIALRGDGRYELKGPLNNIGWRIRKKYFLVTDKDNRTNCLLSYQSYGPDRYLCDKDLQTAFKSLQSMSHPYIDQVLAIHSLETGAYVVRRIHENGSIRDILYGTEYAKSYLIKYGNPKVRKPFTIGQIAHYGYQILQALKFLHDKGIPHEPSSGDSSGWVPPPPLFLPQSRNAPESRTLLCSGLKEKVAREITDTLEVYHLIPQSGHIHPGNIAIENQRALLMDLENAIMGVPCLYRPYILELRRASNAEAVDVYCFGRTLYEMAFATPLDDHYCDFYPDGIPTDLESVLRLCISSAAFKHGCCSLSQLLEHPLFTRASLDGLPFRDDVRMHLKFPLPLKDELRNAVIAFEERLKSDQKLVRSAKREVRIQEILNSEEEMRKQKRRAKKRESLYKSSSSLAETARSQSASTGSSPTPPTHSADTSANGSYTATTSPSEGRAALLDAICSFNKNRLARVQSR